MTTGTPDRFTPRGTLSRADLMAYAEGRLDPAASHEVELHLEIDPLLREALEGLQQPGAVTGLQQLQAHAPRIGNHTWLWWTVSLAVVALVAGTVSLFSGDTPSAQATAPIEATVAPAVSKPTSDTLTVQPELAAAEIMAATEIPESLHIGHATTDRHSIAQANASPNRAAMSEQRTSVEPVRPTNTTLTSGAEHHSASVEHARKPSLQLIYLHDLKLLHPKEMYGRSPDIRLLASGVDARFADAGAQQAAQGEVQRIAYLAFMDEALEKFVHNDHKGCLEELRFMLDQYPEDVNALFYAGLCCYNLGLDQRAERFLRMASEHRFTIFDEEAVWYHALALERTGQRDAARTAFDRIARSTSFYADRAQLKMGR